jgi:hypothetical protein
VQFMEDAMGVIEASITLMTERWDQQHQKSERPQSHSESGLRPLLEMSVNGMYNGKSRVSVVGNADDNNDSALELRQQQQEEERSGFQNGHDSTGAGRDMDDVASQGYSAISVQTFTGNEYEYEYEYDTALSFHSPQAANGTGQSVPAPVHGISVTHPLDTRSCGSNDGAYEAEVAFYDTRPREGIRNSENGHFAAWPAPTTSEHEHWIDSMS